MGCGPSSSEAVIKFDRSPAVFYSNEMVSGTMQLVVNDETVNVDELVMNFIGEAGYTTTEETKGPDGQMQTRTVPHEVSLVSIKHVLATPPAGQKELTYGKGPHVFPFQIQLPANIPPSLFTVNGYPHVRYYVQMYIDRAWYQSNTRENEYIVFIPTVPLSRVANALTPTSFGQQQLNMTIRGSLSKLGYLEGEMIQGMLDIENPHQNMIKQVTVQLIQNTQIGPKPIENSLGQSTVPQIVMRREPRISQPFTISLPARRMTPTYQFQGGLRQSITVNNNFFLKLNVFLEGSQANVEMLVPIIVGNQQ